MNRRIWKTGLMAVVLTAVFAAFVTRVEDWTRGLNSDFLVYGKTETIGTGGTSGGTGTAGTFAVTKLIPQIAVGSFDGNINKYITVIQIVNTGTSSVTLHGNFYKSENGEASDTTYTTNISSVPSIANGVLSDTVLPAGNSMVITGSLPTTTPAVYKGNWGKIQSTGSISIATFFEIRDVATNTLINRVGVSASPTMSRFVIPRTRNVASGLDVAFALANAGTTAVSVTATLRDASGAAIGTKVLTLQPGVQTAQFLGSFFGLTETNNTTSYSYVTFDGGTSAQLGAIALSYEGFTQTSFPVDQLQ